MKRETFTAWAKQERGGDGDYCRTGPMIDIFHSRQWALFNTFNNAHRPVKVRVTVTPIKAQLRRRGGSGRR